MREQDGDQLHGAFELSDDASVSVHRTHQSVVDTQHRAWRCDDGDGDGDGVFDTLESHHFVIDDLPSEFRFRWQQSASAPSSMVLLIGDQLRRQYPQSNDPSTFVFSDVGTLWQDGAWQHATLVPEYESTADTYTGRVNIALWLSLEDKGEEPDARRVDWSEQGADPTWRLMTVASDVYLVYAGPVFDLLQSHPDSLHIRISDETRAPITSQFALFKLEDVEDRDAAERFVEAPRSALPDFRVRYLGTAMLRTETTIEVSGHGVIDGRHLQALPDMSNRWLFRGLPRGKVFKLSDTATVRSDGNGDHVTYQQVLEYQLNSGLITLSSASDAPFAISVESLTVANAPRRHQAAINLNVVTLPMASVDELRQGRFDFEASNRPVHAAGIKVVGNWQDAADGPEVGGDGSLVEHVFLHVADDAIKLAAQDVIYRHATVLQGDAGGVMNIGSYGYNRGVRGSRLEHIHVHRVCQQLHGPHRTAQDDDRGGLITSRTGNFNFLGQGTNGLSDIVIDGLWVAPVGGNHVSRILALGVMGGRRTTRTGFIDRFNPVARFRFGGFLIRELRVPVQPDAPMLVYSQPMRGEGQDAEEMIEWVRLADSDAGIRIEWIGDEKPDLSFEDHHGTYDVDSGFVEVVSLPP
ncbi:MAG: hypothetical protein AAF525_10200 [Pseudomonadota bacterium]